MKRNKVYFLDMASLLFSSLKVILTVAFLFFCTVSLRAQDSVPSAALVLAAFIEERHNYIDPVSCRGAGTDNTL